MIQSKRFLKSENRNIFYLQNVIYSLRLKYSGFKGLKALGND